AVGRLVPSAGRRLRLAGGQGHRSHLEHLPSDVPGRATKDEEGCQQALRWSQLRPALSTRRKESAMSHGPSFVTHHEPRGRRWLVPACALALVLAASGCGGGSDDDDKNMNGATGNDGGPDDGDGAGKGGSSGKSGTAGSAGTAGAAGKGGTSGRGGSGGSG